MIPQLSDAEQNMITPPDIVARARQLMGSIEYDPASSESANRVIKADRFDTAGALERPWQARMVWLNPPGGALRFVDGRWQESTIKVEGPPGEIKRSSHSKAAIYWSKLVHHWQQGDIEQAVFLGFTLEILRTSSSFGFPPVTAFPFCVPSSRIAFLDPVTLKPQKQPTHSNVIAWLPPVRVLGLLGEDEKQKFFETFSDLGSVCCPR